jgi:hypothetical protein
VPWVDASYAHPGLVSRLPSINFGSSLPSKCDSSSRGQVYPGQSSSLYLSKSCKNTSILLRLVFRAPGVIRSLRRAHGLKVGKVSDFFASIIILIHLSEVPAKVGVKFPESRKYVRQKTDNRKKQSSF